MIEILETGITSPALPTLADIERRTEELLAQPPTAALPTPEPRPRPNEPQHSLRSTFDEYALYGLAGGAVRTLAPHTEGQPGALLLRLLAAFGTVIGSGARKTPLSRRSLFSLHSRPRSLHHTLVRHRLPGPRTGGRRDRRTRRIPPGENLGKQTGTKRLPDIRSCCGAVTPRRPREAFRAYGLVGISST